MCRAADRNGEFFQAMIETERLFADETAICSNEDQTVHGTTGRA